ncbi:hypothetical protein GCM10007874_16760 [Labrys miyagiensis]|uniref:Uncharacterized protein n=2 Tax=Labrys miyagiensis TaxID=346912 RepID=A0ABQ6CIW5_9HYPH|nr:hypothetical protein GCM10007874_16760 [Labrys miyagiensis]
MQPARPEPLLSDEDYGAIEAAVMETARGRWFLAEYGRRNRNADTDAVLSAIRRLERLVQSAGTFDARDEVTRGMADIAQAIAAAQIVPATPRGLSAPFEAEAETVVEHPAHHEAALAEAIPAETHEEAFDLVIVEPLATHEAEASMGEPEPSPIEPELQPQPVHEVPVVAEAAVQPPPVGAEEIASLEPEALDIAKADSASALLHEEPAPAQVPPERDVFVELESFLAEAIPAPQAEQVMAAGIPSDPPPKETKAETASAEPFPIIELDEAAAEALLTQDPPRHELILPTNHLVTQRWHKDVDHDAVEPVEAAKPVADEPLRTSLVTFIDEEPVDESESVFSAPLRLEPEEAAERELAPVAEVAEATAASSHPPIVPAMTIGEIEAMPFAKKAVLFS